MNVSGALRPSAADSMRDAAVPEGGGVGLCGKGELRERERERERVCHLSLCNVGATLWSVKVELDSFIDLTLAYRSMPRYTGTFTLPLIG